MPKQTRKDPAEFVGPLNMNGLQGRMLYLPAKGKNKEILFVYGHHSTLEHWWGLIQELNKFGAVTAPDLPGFGGMESLYKIGEKPTIDRYAAYLASFIKLRYKRCRLTIVATDFGFVAATRMLQIYPDIAKKVDLIVSLAALSHHDDFALTPRRVKRYCVATYVMSMWLPATVLRYTFFQQPMLKRAYRNKKFYERCRMLEASAFRAPVSVSTELWRKTDIRTHMATLSSMLAVDNCRSRITVPAWHVAINGNKYLNDHMVEQHMQVIFDNFHQVAAKFDTRDPVDDLRVAARLIPPKLRRSLSKS